MAPLPSEVFFLLPTLLSPPASARQQFKHGIGISAIDHAIPCGVSVKSDCAEQGKHMWCGNSFASLVGGYPGWIMVIGQLAAAEVTSTLDSFLLTGGNS